MSDQMPILTFEVDTQLAEYWEVAAIRGHEEISRPWRYEIELHVHADAPLFSSDIGAVVGEQATLTIEREGDDAQKRVLEGIVAEFHFLGAVPGGWNVHRYRAVMVPTLWLASLRRQSRIFATSEEKTDIEIVKDALTSEDPLGAPAILADGDIDDGGVSGEPPKRDFVMQYEETDLDFYHRRLEKCGVFYVFDDDGKMLLCDANTSVPLIAGETELASRPYAGMTHSNARVVTEVAVTDVMLPGKVLVEEYSYENVDLDLTRDYSVSDANPGVWSILGENYDDPGDGEALAKQRGEEWKCRERVLEASTPVVELSAGRVFTLTDHSDKDFDGDYLVIATEVQAARPTQAGSAVPGGQQVSKPRRLTRKKAKLLKLLAQLDEGDDADAVPDGYQCRFLAIPKGTAYRPARTTPVPRIAGVLSATVDGDDDDEPNIDDDGRYRLHFRFDHSDNADGARSAPVRLMTPFGGEPEGMHTPLRKGTEVLVAFVNGDVDRPVILGTVPNNARPSVVTETNRGSSVIRTSSGVVVTIADF